VVAPDQGRDRRRRITSWLLRRQPPALASARTSAISLPILRSAPASDFSGIVVIGRILPRSPARRRGSPTALPRATGREIRGRKASDRRGRRHSKQPEPAPGRVTVQERVFNGPFRRRGRGDRQRHRDCGGRGRSCRPMSRRSAVGDRRALVAETCAEAGRLGQLTGKRVHLRRTLPNQRRRHFRLMLECMVQPVRARSQLEDGGAMSQLAAMEYLRIHIGPTQGGLANRSRPRARSDVRRKPTKRCVGIDEARAKKDNF
jgi:hypothetical protein